jgi:hypothetical protein
MAHIWVGVNQLGDITVQVLDGDNQFPAFARRLKVNDDTSFSDTVEVATFFADAARYLRDTKG